MKDGLIYVVPSAITTQGMEISHGEPIVVSASDTIALRAAVLEAIQTDFGIIPHPTRDEWRLVPKVLVKAAKMRSWISFATGCRELTIDLMPGERLALHSGRPYAKHRGAFEGNDISAEYSLADDDLGQKVLEALEASEPGAW